MMTERLRPRASPPIRAQLTDMGRIVVDDDDCDVERGLRSRGGGYADHSVHVSNAGHVAVNSSGVVQTGEVNENVLNIEALVSVANVVQNLLPQLDIPDDEATQARGAIADIRSGARDDMADQGRLKAAGGRLVSILSQEGTAAAGTALAAGLIQALHLAGI